MASRKEAGGGGARVPLFSPFLCCLERSPLPFLSLPPGSKHDRQPTLSFLFPFPPAPFPPKTRNEGHAALFSFPFRIADIGLIIGMFYPPFLSFFQLPGKTARSPPLSFFFFFLRNALSYSPSGFLPFLFSPPSNSAPPD